MSDILNNINSSPAPRGIPRQGASTSPVSPDADIAALLAQITSDSPESVSDSSDYDTIDDIGELEDLDKIVESLPAEIREPSLKKEKDSATAINSVSSFDDTNDLIDSDDNEEDSENSGVSAFSKKNIAVALAVVGVIILAVVFVNLIKRNTPSKDPEQSASQPALSLQSTFFADQLSASDAMTYQDSMIIEKYIVLDQDACIFVFKGYAENARAFVTAYVDIETYNRYKTGARVPVLYERISLNGEDYYMKVRINA